VPRDPVTVSQSEGPIYRATSDAAIAASRASAVTAFAMILGVVSSSAVATSRLPRLQGLVATLRLAARCDGGSYNGNDDAAGDLQSDPANDFSENPLQLRLPSSAVAPRLAFATGALLGNSVLVLAVSAVAHTVSMICQWMTSGSGAGGKTSDRSNKRVLGGLRLMLPATPLPAALLLVHGLLLEPTVAAAVVCLGSDDHHGDVSIVLGVVVGLAWMILPCVFLWLLCVRHAPLPLITVAVRRAPKLLSWRWKRASRALEWLCSEREVWVASGRGATDKAAARDVKRRLGAVFEGYRGGRHWYFGVDALLSALTGAVVGAAEAVEAADACDAAVWGTACVGGVGLLSLVCLLALRPFCCAAGVGSCCCRLGLCGDWRGTAPCWCRQCEWCRHTSCCTD
jgi:hypothetical protein